MQEIIVEKVIQYGVENIRIVDEKMRDTVSILTGRKTLAKRHIDALKQMGFTLRTKSVEGVAL